MLNQGSLIVSEQPSSLISTWPSPDPGLTGLWTSLYSHLSSNYTNELWWGWEVKPCDAMSSLTYLVLCALAWLIVALYATILFFILVVSLKVLPKLPRTLQSSCCLYYDCFIFICGLIQCRIEFIVNRWTINCMLLVQFQQFYQVFLQRTNKILF